MTLLLVSFLPFEPKKRVVCEKTAASLSCRFKQVLQVSCITVYKTRMVDK